MYVSSESETRSTTECLESSSWWSTSQRVASTRPSCALMEVKNLENGHVLKNQSGSLNIMKVKAAGHIWSAATTFTKSVVAIIATRFRKRPDNTCARNSFSTLH